MTEQLLLALAPAPAPAFDNFVSGRSLEAQRELERLAAGRDGERFVYLWGEAGSGRTHLLRAVEAALKSRNVACSYVACDAGTAAFDADADCLLADDVERLSEAGQVALFNTYNALRERGGALVATGNAPPAELALRADLVTRLGWGLVYQVHPLGDAEKAAALAEHAGRRGFRLAPEVADYLLHHVRRDMGSLIAALDALDRYSMQAHRAVTLPLARELLKEQHDR
jgi:DnaA family protein